MRVQELKKGDPIIVDKGILGIDKGHFISVDEVHPFGYSGTYIGLDKKEHIWDTMVHKLTKIEKEVLPPTSLV
jgi:hypothetical protein